MSKIEELWKDIDGFEGLYKISNMGRIMSVGKKRGAVRYPDTILEGHICKGYYNVCLSKNYNRKFFDIHRLVALHFVAGYKENLVVNHKNENKLDNRAENLEWRTIKENLNYGSARERLREAKEACQGKKVGIYNTNGILIAEYPSIHAASRDIGVSVYCVSYRCRTGRTDKDGNVWKFIKKVVK